MTAQPTETTLQTQSQSATLREHILFASFGAVTRFALQHGFTLADLKRLLELATYHQGRTRGLKMREMSEAVDVGMSKLGELSRALKDHFAQPERAFGIGRQILSLLWAEPLSVKRIHQSLDHFEVEAIEEALELLVEEGRVSVERGRSVRYALTRRKQRLTVLPWLAMIDGLETLMKHTNLAVDRRFIQKKDDAFVRNVAFRVRPEQIEELRALYEDELFPLICRLDEEASDAEDGVEMRLSVLWAPEADEDA